jgi:hypothetical protein
MSAEADNPKERLNAFFKPFERRDGDDAFGDVENYGDLWEYRHPFDVEYWSIALTPHSNYVAVITKYNGADLSLPVNMEECILDIISAPGEYICVTCVVYSSINAEGSDNDYRFSYMIPGLQVNFNAWPYHSSLKNTRYEGLAKEVEKHINEGRFTDSDGEAYAPDTLAPRIRALLNALAQYKTKLERTKAQMTPLRLTQEVSIQSGSHESILYQTPDTKGSGSRRRKAAASQSENAPTPKKLKAVTTKKSMLAEPMEIDPTSLASALTDIPVESEKVLASYKDSMTIFNNYWAQCTDSYVFGPETTHTIPTEQLHTPPATLNVRNLEQKKVDQTMHFLIEMSNKEKKNTLCVFPKDKLVKPESWEEIKDGEFLMVNGQHCVEASKQLLLRSDVDESVKKHFRSWECFVVWNEDKSIIRKISAYYNRVNHFMNTNPTWATNIIGARELWISLGRPMPPNEATEVGRALAKKKTKAQKQSKDKYEVCAMSFNSTRVELTT